MTARTANTPRRTRDLGLIGLAWAAGGIDAAAYLGLGHAFPANMTGNTVLLGIALARGDGNAGLHSGVALIGFVIGVLLGDLQISGRPAWPRRALGALAWETAVIVALLAVWIAFPHPHGTLAVAMLAAAGLTMGLQSAAARAVGPGGVATTYMTGTLTNAVSRFTERWLERHPESRRARHIRGLAAGIWLVYGTGALSGALLEVHAGAAAFAPSALILVTITLAGVTRDSQAAPATGP